MPEHDRAAGEKLSLDTADSAERRESSMVTAHDRWVTYSGLGLIGSAAIVFFGSILPYCRTFPYTDEWHYVTAASYGGTHFVEWLFAQHVDHRIPLQKALHVFVLKLTGFDFRVLVAINFLIACAVAMLLMSAAKEYRGRASFGDLFIPLCTLSLGAGYSVWGFQFQFLSSTFFVVLFLYLTVVYEKNGQPLLFDLALASLFACSWCGLNGVIMSSLLTIMLLAYLVWERSAAQTRRRLSAYVILAACVIVNTLLWIFWSPSGVSNVHRFSIAAIARFFYGLFNSSLIVYAFQGTVWKFCVLALLLAASLWFGCRLIVRKSKRSLSDVALLGVLCATVLLMLSVAAGRSNYEGWTPGLEMHYGFLTILMPIVSWIIVSSNINGRARGVVGVLLVVLFARAYIANWDWRFASVSESKAENRVVRQQIASGGSAQDIAQEYIRDFYFIDDTYARSLVTSGIKILRQEGGGLYSSQIKTDAPVDLPRIYKQYDEFDDELSDAKVAAAEQCEGNIDVINGVSPAPARFSASTSLKVNGWLAVSVDKAVLPEAVYVVLTSAQGKHKYLRTHRTPRPDVGAYFKKPELNESGYSTMADISALTGQYTLGLAIKQSNQIKMCPQFEISATIVK